MTTEIQSIPHYQSLSGRLSYSQEQVASGVIIATEDQGAEGMAHELTFQESGRPLAKAKDLLVLDWAKNLVFVGEFDLASDKEAYSAVYFYSAGWFDRDGTK